MSLYIFLRMLFRLQFKIMGWKIRGAENMPGSGPVILAINHQSLWDPIVAASSVSRQVHFMAKEELFAVPVLGRIITKVGAFPVRRGQGDINAIRKSLAVLKEEQVLGLFPEGTRSKTGEIQKGMPGMVLLMERSKAPVVPVKVSGTKSLLTKGWGKITVVIGEPLTAQTLKAPEGVENRREWIANQIMSAMQDLPITK